MSWLNSEAFSAFGQDIIWSDMIGNTIGLIALALGWRRSILTWPAQLLSGLILVGAYASAHLSGGIDRLVMLLTNTQTIRDVILFPLLRPEKT